MRVRCQPHERHTAAWEMAKEKQKGFDEDQTCVTKFPKGPDLGPQLANLMIDVLTFFQTLF
jgi:hypothetical protein